MRSTGPSWAPPTATGQRDVRGPLTGQAVRHRAGQQMRNAHPVHLGVQGQQLGRSAPRAGPKPAFDWPNSSGAPTGSRSGSRCATGRSSSSTSAAIPSATASVTCGRPAGACSESAAGQLFPDAPQIAFGVAIEEQLDRMDHQPTSVVTQSRSNACAHIAVNSAAFNDPAPAGSAARTGASRTSADRFDVSTTPGRSGQLPITSPANGRFMCSKRFHRQRGVVEGAELERWPPPVPRRPGRPRDPARSRRLRRVRPAVHRLPRPASAAPDGPPRE